MYLYIYREKNNLSNLMIEVDKQKSLRKHTEQKLDARRVRSTTDEQDLIILLEVHTCICEYTNMYICIYLNSYMYNCIYILIYLYIRYSR
jgi:hypothetical protein